MFGAGFVDEVRNLLEDFGPQAPAFKAIGYRELVRYLADELSLAEAERQTVRATVQYAKRQMTWFKREEGVRWFAGWGEDPDLERKVRGYLRAELDNFRQVGEERLYAETAP